MAFTIFDVGFMEWFDFRTIGTGTITQATSSTFAKVSPYYSIKLGGFNNADMFIKKTLPETTTSFYYTFTYGWDYNWTSTPGSALPSILALEDVNGNELAAIKQTGYGQAKSGMGQIYIGGVWQADIGLPQATCTQIEISFIANSTSGSFVIWINGEQVFTFTGNTGSVPVARVAHKQGARVDGYYSNFVASNEGRIGGKLPVLCNLVGPGTLSEGSFTNFVGNVTSGTGNNSQKTATKTITMADTCTEGGTVKQIKTYLYTGGTYKVGIVTVNASNGLKRTVKYVSDVITSAAGAVTLTAGVDFPANWIVTANDSIALCALTAVIASDYGYTYNRVEGGTCLAMSLDADGLNAADATEKTYTLINVDGAGKAYTYRLAAVYTATNPSNAYKISSDESKLYVQANTEAHRFLEQTAVDQTNLFIMKSLPIACNSIRAIKFGYRGVGGATINAADFILRTAAAQEYTVRETLPTSVAYADAYMSGTWDPAQVSGAQIGIRAKTV